MREISLIFVLVCILAAFSFVSAAHMNYEQLYDVGMTAYKNEKWTKCVDSFKGALKDYKTLKKTVIDCRLQCDKNSSITFPSYTSFFHDILVSSDCLRRCKKKRLPRRLEEDISYTVDKKFEDRQPYNYIQFCYFKAGQVKEAAAAAYTFYITHQSEQRVIDNMQYYRQLEELSETDFVDLERKPYQKAYINALLAYNEGQWTKCAPLFEESLTLYYVEEERCRAGCQRSFSHSGVPDFINAVADHYITVIVCQQKCIQQLSTFGIEELENFVAEHYNYLQYAYFQENYLQKASESIASFLLFHPNNQEMVNNKQYYMDHLGFKPEDFIPAASAVKYVNHWREIDKSLDFVRDHYLLPNEQLPQDEETSNRDPVQNNGPRKYDRLEKFFRLGIALFAEEGDLHGSDRFAADGMIREDQCLTLLDLAKTQKPDKLGIQKINLQKSLSVVAANADYDVSLRLFVRASDVLAAYSSSYFNTSALIQEAYIVCIPSGIDIPSDCYLQEDGACRDESPTADYIALVYLSSQKDGGGYLSFTTEENEVQVNVLPVFGRIVGFSSESYHLVQPTKHGERCSLVVHLTLDERQKTPDFVPAVQMLSIVEEKRKKDWLKDDSKDILEQFFSQGVKIVMGEKELMGEERFVADGLSTDGECNQLIQLAQQHGVSGNGYHGNRSPHTVRELYTGLEVVQVTQTGGVRGDGYVKAEDHTSQGVRYASPYTKSERFQGLNISRTLKLVEEGVVDVHNLHLLLDISENGRLLVEKYFDLEEPLYFDYTHLVCRTAVQDPSSDGTDHVDVEIPGETEKDGTALSHPVHSDNCMIQPDGSCLENPLTFKQRHYSAVLYLNDDFEGGQFFFAHKNKSEQVSLSPKCGRFVAFNAGEYHGVKAVRQGQRCAIAMWFTHDANYIEVSRVHSWRQLERLDKLNPIDSSIHVQPPEQLSDIADGSIDSHDEL